MQVLNWLEQSTQTRPTGTDAVCCRRMGATRAAGFGWMTSTRRDAMRTPLPRTHPSGLHRQTFDSVTLHRLATAQLDLGQNCRHLRASDILL